jgi:hypothetical protein
MARAPRLTRSAFAMMVKVIVVAGMVGNVDASRRCTRDEPAGLPKTSDEYRLSDVPIGKLPPT